MLLPPGSLGPLSEQAGRSWAGEPGPSLPVPSHRRASPLVGGAAPLGSPVRVGGGVPGRPRSMAAALAFWGPESRARAGGLGGLRAPAPVTMDSFFFGIEEGGLRVVLGRGEEGMQRGARHGWGRRGLARGCWSGSGGQTPAQMCGAGSGLSAQVFRRSGRVNGGRSVHGHT